MSFKLKLGEVVGHSSCHFRTNFVLVHVDTCESKPDHCSNAVALVLDDCVSSRALVGFLSLSLGISVGGQRPTRISVCL